MEQAAIYCRSSKDRAEVGLDVQRAELKAFAKGKGLGIAAEFSDMEISGSLDETARPGLRNLLTELRAPARAWNTLLALDTSRIARDPVIGLFVTREAEKHGVTIQYAKMPVDGSSAFGETMLSVVRAFDRLHARLSAEKGRGGLAANIEKGFRAGGAAPIGYKLQHHETGGVRGGQAVQKSTLVPDARAAKKVREFLKARAAGVSRSEAAKAASLGGKAVASLIAIERNALTYAGHTVWNQRRKVKPTRDDPRKTMELRPRAEWMISEKRTHEALITRDEAERILARFEHKVAARPRVRNPDDFLLSGLLFTPTGVQWHGDAYEETRGGTKAYRAGTKGRRASAPWVEGEVLYRVAADFKDPAFLARTVQEARRMADAIEADPQVLEVEIRREEKRLRNLVELGAESGAKSVLAKIHETEAHIGKLREQKATWDERAALKRRLLDIKQKDIRDVLTAHGIELRDGKGVLEMLGYSDEQRLAPAQLRKFLTTVIERVELDPETRELTLRYRLPVTGVKVASPRGFEPRLPP